MFGATCPSLTCAVFDLAHLGASFLVRSLVHLGIIISFCGLARTGFMFSPFVVDCSHPGSTSPVRSSVRSSAILFASDFFQLDLSLISRFLARVDFVVVLFGVQRLEALLPALDFSQLSVSLAPHLSSCPELFIFILCDIDLSSLLLLQSLVQAGSALVVLDFLHLGTPSFLRGCARLGIL